MYVTFGIKTKDWIPPNSIICYICAVVIRLHFLHIEKKRLADFCAR